MRRNEMTGIQWMSNSQLLLFSHSVVSNSATPWTAARQAFLFIGNSRSLLKLMSIESVMPSNHLMLCRPLLLPSIFPSIRVFSNEAGLHIRWPMYWIQLQHQSFSFNIIPSNEHPGLISFRLVWLDFLIFYKMLIKVHIIIQIKNNENHIALLLQHSI